MRRHRAWIAGFGLLFLSATSARSTPPPRGGGALPESFQQRLDTDPNAFTIDLAVEQVQQVQANRAAAARGAVMGEKAVEKAGGIIIKGDRFLPVIPVRFKGEAEPLDRAELQKAIFDGEGGTLSSYYHEVSYGLLSVKGEVFPWQELSHEAAFYAGDVAPEDPSSEPCNGLCGEANIGEMVKESLDAADPFIDFSKMDLSGLKGVPDGFVDAVAIMHSERGAECGKDETKRNIWSHQGSYRRLMRRPYVTKDKGPDGKLIKIDTFLIVPALDCDLPGANRIGIITHEFGHTLGLQDLYDTDGSDGRSDSVGNWDLMSTGAWGGDGKSPEKPVHLSAWSKAFLGWIFPDEVKDEARYQPGLITQSEKNRLSYKLKISPKSYYLVENRQTQGFDEKLPGSGLLVWKIDEPIANAGIKTNRVNATVDKGVSLVQAGINARGDVFPGRENLHQFDNNSAPASESNTAVCGISDSSPSMTASLFVSMGQCPDGPLAQAAAPARLAPPASEPPPAPVPPRTNAIPIKEVLEKPKEYLGRKIVLVGKLVNLGTNYFTDARIAVQDLDGNAIGVHPWLPLEVAPSKLPAGPTLSSYLDKKVELVGELKQERAADGKETLVLDVESGEVAPPL